MRVLFLCVIVLAVLPAALPAAQWIVTTSGLTFNPPTLTISAGDTVVFSITLLHNAVEVAESDWNTNTNAPLPGGFAIPFGGGSVVLTDTGTRFYICQAHIDNGMKAKIIVSTPVPPPSTITINSVADRDGSTGTTGDRVSKRWSLKLYQDSVGSGIVLDSVSSGSTLSVTDLLPGTYVAAEADSVSWTHFSMTVDGVPQGNTSQSTWSFTVGTGENRSVTFLNTAPNMIITSGLTFVPDTMIVDSGDTVFFVPGAGHTAREVSKSTWLANGTTSNGGFDLPDGGGTYVTALGGIDYYICVPHAAAGMKGLIMVNPIPPSTITVNSLADQDGNHATIADRVVKNWSLRLYQDSVGSGIVVDSTDSGSSLTVAGLGPGVYVAAEADSVPWSHISQTADGISLGSSTQTTRVFSVGSGESRSVDFINHVPNMIISSGLAFSPETLTVDSGVIVWFVLDPMHTARQVDSAVWAANDTVSNGGFDLPSAGGYVLMDQPGEAYYVCVPHAPVGMKGIVRVTVEPYAGTLEDTVDAGWNLLSFPFAIPESAVTALYPAAVSRAYVYESGFTTRSAVGNGPGYFLKFPAAGAVDFSGILVASDTLPLLQGWNIVGSVSAPVPVSALESIPPGLVMTPFFGYDSGYSIADTITPGRGYWVKATGAGSLLISAAPGAVPSAGRIRIVPTSELPPPPPGADGEPGQQDPAPAGGPGAFGLTQNYPNPFNPSTRIAYSLDRELRVKVSVYNMTGERVATLVDALEGPGVKTTVFDGAGLPGGVYIVRILAGGRSESMKMVLMK